MALSTGVIAQTPLVEFETMTWPEVKQALADGKTTALHMYFCDEVYANAQGDFDRWLESQGYPRTTALPAMPAGRAPRSARRPST